MGVPTVVISNPPHGEFDALRAAPHLALTAAEAGLKARYPIPEIWVAEDDRGAAEAHAMGLREAGLNVAVLAGEELRDVPWQAVVRSFAFADGGLEAELEDADVALPWDLPVVAVVCIPRSQAAGEGPPAEGVGARGAFLDLYAWLEERLQRIAVVPDRTGFSGLERAAVPSAAGNLLKFVAVCEGRFQHARFDRRLASLQLRRRHTVPGTIPSGAQRRKGFSYATDALCALLGSISPELGDVSQCELCSRLAYLARR